MKNKYLLLIAGFIAVNSNAAEFSTQIIERKDVRSMERAYVGHFGEMIDPETGLEVSTFSTIHNSVPNKQGVSINKFEEFGFSTINIELDGPDGPYSAYVPAVVQMYSKDNTKLAIYEVTGSKASWMNGMVLNMNKDKIDFILSNPNGYRFSGQMQNFGDYEFTTSAVELDALGGFSDWDSLKQGYGVKYKPNWYNKKFISQVTNLIDSDDKISLGVYELNKLKLDSDGNLSY